MSVGESNIYINDELVVNPSTSSSCKPDSFVVPKISRGKRQMPNTNSDCSSNKRSNINDDDDVEIIEEFSRSFDCSHSNFRYFRLTNNGKDTGVQCWDLSALEFMIVPMVAVIHL